ncbi:MAG: type III-B CRISPR module-associated Cmr3 family protein [Candidatus Baldrarchaeia archaeon]
MSGASFTGIRLRIVEPMMFRGPGEFDPSSRGLQSSAKSLLLPSPSTISGLLATIILHERPVSLKDAQTDDWVKEYLNILGGDFSLRGVFLFANGKEYLEDRINNKLITLENAKRKCEAIYNVLKYKNNVAERFEKVKEEIGKMKGIGTFNERVGIGLETRTALGKKAKEGYIYVANFVDYSSPENKIVKVDIHVDVSGEIFKTLILKGDIRLGGEGRIAKIYQTDVTMLDILIDKLWNKTSEYSGNIAIYVTSPMLFKTSKSLEELKKQITKQIQENCNEVINLKTYGQTEPLGTGYSLHRGLRKPIYTAIKPGSIIFAELNKCNLKELYSKGLGEVGREIGYGSVIPIPLE